MNLKQALEENKKQIDNFLFEYLNKKKEEANKYGGELSIHVDLIEKQILRSGKRIRPFLLGLTYTIAGGVDKELVIRLGSAVELLHQYFLIHDDIVDKDDKRYGDLSLHKAFENEIGDSYSGMSMAIIAGDYINSLVHEIIINTDIEAGKKIEILKLLHQTIQNTMIGWQIHYFQNKIPIEQGSEERYLKGMELVSAKYTFETPALIGLMMQNNQELIPDLKECARLVGMAFQIQDDILGVFGNTNKTGKPAGNDLREGKKTLLILKAYKNANIEQKKFISNNLGKEIDQQQLDELRDIITQTGSLTFSQDMARSYINEAKLLLDNINVNSDKLEMFRQLADFVISREK